MKPNSRATLLAAGACLCLFAASALAQAEVVREGNLQGSFNGAISPQRLPRTQLAPVNVAMGGKITTTDRTVPPKLEQITLAINSHGVLQDKGLATCSLAKLELGHLPAGPKELRRCPGRPRQRHLPGLAARAGGLCLQRQPARLQRQAPWQARGLGPGRLRRPPAPHLRDRLRSQEDQGHLRHRAGRHPPPIASEYGYISSFSLSLGRTYESHGKQLSFASASCPAPKGFPGASFPFVKASYAFADGRDLEATLNRDCKVRGK